MQTTRKSVNPPSESSSPVFESVPVKKFCPNPATGLKFFNTLTCELSPLPCNRYSCPVCSVRKLARLRKALREYFSKFKHIRLWTFTLSSRVASDRSTHYKILSECWRRLITEIRRSKTLTPKMRNFNYVRVCEPHNLNSNNVKFDIFNDYFHLHCLFTEYIPFDWIQATWDHICMEYCGESNHVASANVKGLLSSRSAAHYVCKYVAKGAQLMNRYQKKWTKSARVSIFPVKYSSGDWIVINMSFDFCDYFENQEVLRNFTCNSIDPTSHDPPANLQSEIDFLANSTIPGEHIFSRNKISDCNFLSMEIQNKNIDSELLIDSVVDCLQPIPVFSHERPVKTIFLNKSI